MNRELEHYLLNLCDVKFILRDRDSLTYIFKFSEIYESVHEYIKLKISKEQLIENIIDSSSNYSLTDSGKNEKMKKNLERIRDVFVPKF